MLEINSKSDYSEVVLAEQSAAVMTASIYAKVSLLHFFICIFRLTCVHPLG